MQLGRHLEQLYGWEKMWKVVYIYLTFLLVLNSRKVVPQNSPVIWSEPSEMIDVEESTFKDLQWVMKVVVTVQTDEAKFNVEGFWLSSQEIKINSLIKSIR